MRAAICRLNQFGIALVGGVINSIIGDLNVDARSLSSLIVKRCSVYKSKGEVLLDLALQLGCDAIMIRVKRFGLFDLINKLAGGPVVGNRGRNAPRTFAEICGGGFFQRTHRILAYLPFTVGYRAGFLGGILVIDDRLVLHFRDTVRNLGLIGELILLTLGLFAEFIVKSDAARYRCDLIKFRLLPIESLRNGDITHDLGTGRLDDIRKIFAVQIAAIRIINRDGPVHIPVIGVVIGSFFNIAVVCSIDSFLIVFTNPRGIAKSAITVFGIVGDLYPVGQLVDLALLQSRKILQIKTLAICSKNRGMTRNLIAALVR